MIPFSLRTSQSPYQWLLQKKIRGPRCVAVYKLINYRIFTTVQPSVFRSIFAGSTAGAVEIGKQPHLFPPLVGGIPANPSHSYHIPSGMYGYPPQPRLPSKLIPYPSRKNSITTQPEAPRRQETAMAAVRDTVVRRMYLGDCWKLPQGGNSWVSSPVFRVAGYLAYIPIPR